MVDLPVPEPRAPTEPASPAPPAPAPPPDEDPAPAAPTPLPTREPDDTPPAAVLDEQQVATVLESALEHLGSAHHRPFSRQ